MAKLTDYLSEEFLLKETNPGQKTSLVKDILVDADALVALIKADDSNHKKAIKINNKLQKKGTTYYLSPFTAAEVITVLSYKVSQQAAKNFLKGIRKLDLPILKLEEKHSNLADKWFLKQNKKGISYFDCYNMALLERYKAQIMAIFSFDAIYKRNGFRLAKT
mgnify:CR=1 FL=1